MQQDKKVLFPPRLCPSNTVSQSASRRRRIQQWLRDGGKTFSQLPPSVRGVCGADIPPVGKPLHSVLLLWKKKFPQRGWQKQICKLLFLGTANASSHKQPPTATNAQGKHPLPLGSSLYTLHMIPIFYDDNFNNCLLFPTESTMKKSRLFGYLAPLSWSDEACYLPVFFL